MKVDSSNEVVHVAETSSRILHPLDSCVNRLTGGIGNPMLQIRDDIGEATLEHFGHFHHGLESTANGPLIPPSEVFAGWFFIDVIEKLHSGLP